MLSTTVDGVDSLKSISESLGHRGIVGARGLIGEGGDLISKIETPDLATSLERWATHP